MIPSAFSDPPHSKHSADDETVDVALFLPSLEGGGAEQVFVTLARLFSDRGLRVDLVVVRIEGPLFDRIPPQVRLIDLRASRPSRGIPSLIRYLRHQRPRALLSALTHANLAAIVAHRLARPGGRCVLSERTDLSVALKRRKTPFDRFLVKIFMRLLYPGAHAVIAVSQGVARSVQQLTGIDEARLHVIYNPIDTSRLQAIPDVPVHFPWNDSHPVFIAVGRLTEAKNFPLLLRAFRQVRDEKPCHLAILGEGEEREKLERLVNELRLSQDVWMPGFLENPCVWMAQAQALVSSSDWEGLSNTLIEALALNLPVIATDCPSGTSEILERGRHGILIPVGDEQALTNAMKNVLDGKAPAYDHDKAIQRFMPDRIAMQYLNILGIES